jgi:hypothetical protein
MAEKVAVRITKRTARMTLINPSPRKNKGFSIQFSAPLKDNKSRKKVSTHFKGRAGEAAGSSAVRLPLPLYSVIQKKVKALESLPGMEIRMRFQRC